MSHRFANLVSLNRNYLSRLIHLLNYLNIPYIPVMPVTVQHITVRPVTVLVFTHNFTIHIILSQFARTCLHLSINILTLYMVPKTQTTHTSMFIICMLGSPSENRGPLPLSLGSCCCFQEDLVLINDPTIQTHSVHTKRIDP